MTQSTKFQFDFLVYTVWACLKAMTPYKTLKEESTDKHHCKDNYSAPFAYLPIRHLFSYDEFVTDLLIGTNCPLLNFTIMGVSKTTTPSYTSSTNGAIVSIGTRVTTARCDPGRRVKLFLRVEVDFKIFFSSEVGFFI